MDATNLEELDAMINARQKQWLGRWYGMHAQPAGDKLFHYTDSNGLLGILRSEVFWATNIEYLNDSSELAYCIALIRDHLERKKIAVSRNALSPISRLFVAAQKTFNPFRDLTVYVSCFCEQGDLLGQWRGYGREGGGYAIGIQPRYGKAAPDEEPRIVLRKVLYELQDQEQLIDESISQLEALWTHVTRKTKDEPTLMEAQKKILAFFRQEVGDYIWCFKNPAFREEKEWRFSYITGAKDPKKRQVNFRPGPGSISPYVELDLFKLLDSEKARALQVCEVICGPTLHPRHSVEC
ncbi:MAG: DUF2971 domain-containing protein [Betaproteobacteria bacterium]|nr:DUF2971 domain-containing protein [Betaproteobacteria bacterium]